MAVNNLFCALFSSCRVARVQIRKPLLAPACQNVYVGMLAARVGSWRHVWCLCWRYLWLLLALLY